jgi:hypothetical protein
MREKSELLIQRYGVLTLRPGIALKDIFRDGVGNAVIEAAVESSKFVYLDRLATLIGQTHYRLAQIPVVMHHLNSGEALL